jgi:hypothetical protein
MARDSHHSAGDAHSMTFQFWVPLLISFLSVTFTGATYWQTFFPHRVVLFTVAKPRGGTTGEVTADKIFDLPVIIANSGNRTEIISCVCLAVIPPDTADNEYQSSLTGPYVLKSGEAVTVPLQLSFDNIVKHVGNGDVDVHIVAVSPDNDMIGVDIPISRMSFSQSEGQIKYTESTNPAYKKGLTDIFSEFRSKFTNCQEGRSGILSIRITR